MGYRINELTQQTGANLAVDDDFLVFDTSTSTTKRLTKKEFHAMGYTSVDDYGADPTDVADSSAAIQSAVDSGKTKLYARGSFKLSTTVTIPKNVTLDGTGATFTPTANVDLFRLHGSARLVGFPVLDVTTQVGWNKACVLLDGDSETGGDTTNFRMHEPTYIKVHCIGNTTGSGNGDMIHYKTTDGASNSWIMGTDVEVFGSGFDNALHITRAGTDATKVFINGNRIKINHTYALRSIYMESTNGDNINSNWINVQGQSRVQNDQTATPLVIKGNYNTIETIQFDWLGGALGTLDVLDIASQSIGNIIKVTGTDVALIANNSASRSNTIINPLGGVGWMFGDISSVISGSNIRCWSPMRFENGSTLGIGFRDAAGTSEWQAMFADSSDYLTIRSATTAASRVVVNANNATGRIDFRINNTNAAYVDANKHLVLPGSSGFDAAIRNSNTAARDYDFADVSGILTTKVAVPATLTSSGVLGAWAIDSDYAYFCRASDTWERTPVQAWRVLAKSAVAVSHTGDTNETTLATITVPAGAMGPNGFITVRTQWSYTNSANTKTLRVKFGGTTLIAPAPTTTASLRQSIEIFNRDSASSQMITPNSTNTASAYGATTTAVGTAAINTANAADIVLTAQLANSGETATLESYVVELCYGA